MKLIVGFPQPNANSIQFARWKKTLVYVGEHQTVIMMRSAENTIRALVRYVGWLLKGESKSEVDDLSLN